MASRWIVSAYRFHEHESLHSARKERARLAKAFPAKKFRVMQVKTHLAPSKSRQIIADLNKQIDDLKRQLAALQPDA